MPTEATNSGEPNTETTSQAPVTFTTEQQAEVNKIIEGRLAREKRNSQAAIDAEKQARADAEKKLQDLLANQAPPPVTPADDTQSKDQIAEYKRVAEQSRAEVEAARRAAEAKASEAKLAQDRLTDHIKQTAISKAAEKAGFIDPSIVVQLVKGSITLDEEGKLTVVGDNGQQRFNAQFQPMTIDEYMAEFATQRSYLVRGDTKTGIGSAQSAGIPGVGNIKLDQIFGPKSSASKAMELKKRDPARYKAMKAQAAAEGLIAG